MGPLASLILERCEQAYSLFKSMGFAGWDKDSIDNISTLLTAFQEYSGSTPGYGLV